MGLWVCGEHSRRGQHTPCSRRRAAAAAVRRARAVRCAAGVAWPGAPRTRRPARRERAIPWIGPGRCMLALPGGVGAQLAQFAWLPVDARPGLGVWSLTPRAGERAGGHGCGSACTDLRTVLRAAVQVVEVAVVRAKVDDGCRLFCVHADPARRAPALHTPRPRRRPTGCGRCGRWWYVVARASVGDNGFLCSLVVQHSTRGRWLAGCGESRLSPSINQPQDIFKLRVRVYFHSKLCPARGTLHGDGVKFAQFAATINRARVTATHDRNVFRQALFKRKVRVCDRDSARAPPLGGFTTCTPVSPALASFSLARGRTRDVPHACLARSCRRGRERPLSASAHVCARADPAGLRLSRRVSRLRLEAGVDLVVDTPENSAHTSSPAAWCTQWAQDGTAAMLHTGTVVCAAALLTMCESDTPTTTTAHPPPPALPCRSVATVTASRSGRRALSCLVPDAPHCRSLLCPTKKGVVGGGGARAISACPACWGLLTP